MLKGHLTGTLERHNGVISKVQLRNIGSTKSNESQMQHKF